MVSGGRRIFQLTDNLTAAEHRTSRGPWLGTLEDDPSSVSTSVYSRWDVLVLSCSTGQLLEGASGNNILWVFTGTRIHGQPHGRDHLETSGPTWAPDWHAAASALPPPYCRTQNPGPCQTPVSGAAGGCCLNSAMIFLSY